MDKNTSEKELFEAIKKLDARSVIGDDLLEDLNEYLEVSANRGKELSAIMRGAKTVLKQEGFLESARAIFDYCKDLIGATSGYVALLSDNGEENEVLFLESGGLPCDVDPALPMPIRGLRAVAYHTNQSVYHNDFMNSEWVDFMPAGHVVLNNVMFAPLVIEGKTVGIMGLANKASDYTDNDAKMAAGFGELAAIALQNSRNRDQRITAEKEREKVIQELNQAVERIHEQKMKLETAYEDLKAMQAELVESRKMAALGNLVGGIAHEINTPLGVSITGVSVLNRKIEKFQKMLGDEEMTNEELADFFRNASQSGNLVFKNLTRAADLVKTFKKLAAGDKSNERKTLNLKSYLHEIVNSLLPKRGDKKVHVNISCDEELIIESDPGALAQIIINLYMNSLIHGFSDSEGGNISIAAGVRSGNVEMTYQDDGQGISESMMPDIFDPFVTSNRQKGSGLGLNIVYNLVKQTFNGSIRCESAEGEGTRLFISFPSAPGENHAD